MIDPVKSTSGTTTITIDETNMSARLDLYEAWNVKTPAGTAYSTVTLTANDGTSDHTGTVGEDGTITITDVALNIPPRTSIPPRTGDNLALYAIITVLAACGIAGGAFFITKKKKDSES